MERVSMKISLDFNNTERAFGHLSDKELNRAILLFRAFGYPFLVKYGAPFATFSLKIGLPVKGLLKRTVFNHFCGGESIPDCKERVAFLNKYHVKTILDYSVEGEEKEDVFDATCAEIIKTIEEAAVNPAIPFAVFKVTGVGRFALLQKVSEGVTLNPQEEAEVERVKNRVEAICKKGHELNVQVMIDAEETWIQPAIDALVLEMSEKYNQEKVLIFNTVQLYRHDRLSFLKECFEKYRFPLGFKLVRGAYMEKERVRAAEKSYPSPIQPDKATSDRDYDEAVALCLQNISRCEVVIGTHNEQSCRKAAERMSELGITPSDSRVYFSQLLGMSDNIGNRCTTTPFIKLKVKTSKKTALLEAI
ncbi:MAG: proline dehydrogenase family protein [Bacteroidia bacterium]|nr:proline dehydrogenase family protein [Bacteroidia bacterium]